MTATPPRRAARQPIDLFGSRPNAAGETMWAAEEDRAGRVYLTISAYAPTGDLLIATARYPHLSAAIDALPGALERFERTTLAKWDHPPATRQKVRRGRGWILTVGREPGALPLIRLVRVTAAARMRPGWDSYEISSARSTPRPQFLPA